MTPHIPKCLRVGNPCKTHKNGRYRKWLCNLDVYKVRRNYYLKMPRCRCMDCGAITSPNTKRCRKCQGKVNGRLRQGIKLPKIWRENILKNNPFVQKGEKHPQWVGDKIGYSGVHNWIRKVLGNPDKCSKCGRNGKKNGRNWDIQWANISGKYLRLIEDYKALCPRCHSVFDEKYIQTENYIHGTVSRYNRKCRCELCLKAKSLYRKGKNKFKDIITE